MGIATLYRRFPTRDDLIAACFERRVADYARAAEEALEAPDPWAGFSAYVERICAMQAADRGLKDVLTRTFPNAGAMEAHRTRGYELSVRVIERTQAAGALRADFVPEDLVLLLMANAGVVQGGGEAAPDAWRRFVALMLEAFRADGARPAAATPLPAPVLRAMRAIRQLIDHRRSRLMTATFQTTSRIVPVGPTNASPDGYQPGVCNIGPAEIARRRRAGHVGLAATLVLLTRTRGDRRPAAGRLLVALPAAAAASGYLQARFKFCAGFGSKGIYNFGELGTTVQVEEAEARRRDRSRANQIGLASAAIGCRRRIVAVGAAAVTVEHAGTSPADVAEQLEEVAAVLAPTTSRRSSSRRAPRRTTSSSA